MLKSTVLLVLALSAGVAFAEDSKPAPVGEVKAATSGAAAEVKAGTGVEKHEVVGEATSFSAGTTVWVWSKLTNAQGKVKHVWKLDGKDVWTATMPVGSKLWTTSSRRTLPKPGAWSVDVQTEDGASIGTVSFTIQ